MKNVLRKIVRKAKKSMTYKEPEVKQADYIEEEPEWVDETVMAITETDRNKVWAFCAGQYSNDFRGNPKWLFFYINKYRKDITAYWICESVEIIEEIRAMGYLAYRYDTYQAEQAINRTGVLVAEQVKMGLPPGMENVKYLNLWHGVGGVKNVERSLTEGILAEEIAKKYIKKNTYYRTHELYVAPSDFIEGIAKEQLGLTDEQIIHAGYARNLYQTNFDRIATYDHDFINQRELPEDTRIVAYAPTYRADQQGELFTKAIPDMDKLISVCEKEHILMIFKMHPILENEKGFNMAREAYADCKWVMFWDNAYDFYEVMDQVDLCIMDYSSIFTDFIAMGTKHFLRYAFDFDESDLNFPMGYDEATPGKKSLSFEELLEDLTQYRDYDDSEAVERLSKLYWEYSDPKSLDVIVDKTLEFVPREVEKKTLYSFDIFDTLISRRALLPRSIFYKVRDKMEESDLDFPRYLLKNYVMERIYAERNMREYYNRSILERDDERCEISMDEIMDRIALMHNLNKEQKEALKQWELDAELEDVIPIPKQIEHLKSLLEAGEKVILVSDMYLPKEHIQKMIAKADPVLAELPLFLSSEYGYQKSRKSLYLEIYRQYGVDYDFDRWIHTGDNKHSDINMAKSMGITTRKAPAVQLDEYEEEMLKSLDSYEGCMVAAQMARFRAEHSSDKDIFAYRYASLLFVPYVYWAIHDAIKNGDEIVYFISRDGHNLKKIADAIIEEEGLNIETKYIYASRRTWRIPSFFDHIDVGFWGQGYGNFSNVTSFSKLLKALDMNEEEFNEIFPELSNINEETEITVNEVIELTEIFKNSKKYESFLLAKAAEERTAVCGYLKQEMDVNKKFSIIEYWGRGYTQENFTRLWQHIIGKKEPVTFYYSRSTLPSDQDNIRKNFIMNSVSQSFVESIFANIDYKSIERYNFIDGKWIPEIVPLECDFKLFKAMEHFLPEFARWMCGAKLNHIDGLVKELMEYGYTYYVEKPQWKDFIDNLAPLKDSFQLYGKKEEFAKKLSMEDLEAIKNQEITVGKTTKNINMSYIRSAVDVQDEMRRMFQIRRGELIESTKVLTDERIAKGEDFKKKFDGLRESINIITSLYDKYVSELPVENKILLFTTGKDFDNPIWKTLLYELNNTSYTVEKMALGCKIPRKEIARAMATSKFIIIPQPLKQTSKLQFRKDTKIIVLGDSAVQYFEKGLAKKFVERTEGEYKDILLRTDIDILQVPSENALDRYKKIYNVSSNTEFLVSGSVVTDVYFDEEYKKAQRAKLNDLFPSAKDKKLICYIPFFRYRNAECKFAELLDFEILKPFLGDEYVLALHMNSKGEEYVNHVTSDSCYIDLTGIMPPRDIMVAADVIVGDYRDLFFEAPLLDVPVFSTCWDVDNIQNKKTVFENYSDMSIGVKVKDTIDLGTKLTELDEYSFENCKEFKDKYLAMCDGLSAKRLVEVIDKYCENEGSTDA